MDSITLVAEHSEANKQAFSMDLRLCVHIYMYVWCVTLWAPWGVLWERILYKVQVIYFGNEYMAHHGLTLSPLMVSLPPVRLWQ